MYTTQEVEQLLQKQVTKTLEDLANKTLGFQLNQCLELDLVEIPPKDVVKQIVITNEQFRDLEHYRGMFEVQADNILSITKQEQHDLNIGFELGQIYSHQRDCFMELGELLSSFIKNND